MQKRYSVKEAKQLLEATENKKKPTRKYRNKVIYLYKNGLVLDEKVESYGKPVHFFDSKKEYDRYVELSLMQRGGVISDLELQKTLEIQESQIVNDEKLRAITYKADFAYKKDGMQIIEDVKAFDKKKEKYITTETFDLKWKLLKVKYPEYKFVLF